MTLQTRSLLGIAALAAVAACSSENAVGPATSPSFDKGGTPHFLSARVCDVTPAGTARCHSWVRVDDTGEPLATSGPSGYGPTDLRTAYGLTSASASDGTGQTIGIVDAYDDPNAETDLAVYRSTYGLPACTTANGCFRKVNQTGGTVLPKPSPGWAEEISLDLDMASAICPNCHIVLVEAQTASISNLGASVNEAVALGANVVSNSYGGHEYAGETSDELTFYNHPGVAITVSSGDAGFGVEFPAASRYVTAVGGTTLARSSDARGFAETVWAGAGSGCSAFVAKPSWQLDAGCAQRTVADVAAIADPNTGVSVYDTYHVHPGHGGWLVFGGTSVASPIIASVYALSGNASSLNYGSWSYSHLSSVFDVVSGSNGSCGGSYLCTGTVGYDGPTGNGTPNGIGAF
jgi:subtilase family serine protease